VTALTGILNGEKNPGKGTSLPEEEDSTNIATARRHFLYRKRGMVNFYSRGGRGGKIGAHSEWKKQRGLYFFVE